MDFLFLKLWVEEISGDIIIKKFRKAFWDEEKYIFDLQQDFLNISLLPGDSICFFSDKGLKKKEETTFTKLITQHLSKSVVKKITIEENDKLISVEFQKINIYGNKIRYRLILELINRYENMILTRKDESCKWIILGAHRKVNFAENRFRQILPGMEYNPPPPIKKPYILGIKEKEFYKLTDDKLPNEWQSFLQFFSNVPQFLKDEFAPKMLSEEFWHTISKMKYNNFYLSDKNYLSLINKGDFPKFSKINDAFNFYYVTKSKHNIFNQLKNTTLQKLQKQAKKITRTIEKESEEYREMEDSEKWKKFGELLKTSFSKIKRGQKEIAVTDYFAENTPEIRIPLNEEWNAEKNMEFYFKKYKKAKSGKAKLHKHINSNKKKLQMTLEKISIVKKCENIKDLEKFQIRRVSDKKRHVEKKLFRKFLLHLEEKEWEIFIGRNNKENDELTNKFAGPDDWFFHSRIYHGAHIIVKNPDKLEALPKKVMQIAAGFAAYYSKAKHSNKAPVDFTKIKYVSKPRKSPPGFVIYKNQKTLFVVPINPRMIE